MTARCDVVIVGAGAAGLAAAAALAAAGVRVVVLEARSRTGGRVFTRHDARVPLAIEHGAEFVHGGAERTHALAREARLALVTGNGAAWRAEHGRLRCADDEMFGGVDRVLERIDKRAPDRPLDDWLATRPGGRGAGAVRARARTRAFVQGFLAADPARASTHALAPEPGAPPTDNARHTSRIIAGQAALLAHLARGAPPPRLGHVVRAVGWRRGRVRVDGEARGRAFTVEARAAIVTVPLGVLRARAGRGAIAFDPDPPRVRAAIDGLEMGHAVHLAVLFREWPWARRRNVPADLGFLFTPRGPFSVWWTPHPIDWPLAVAWSGGPPAAALAGLPRARVLDRALAGLAHALRLAPARLRTLVEASWLHDWTRDPFARGAYAYTLTGGGDPAATLARPVERTLLFAGEATDAEHAGTVEGAIASGRRAARQARAALA